MALGIHTFNEFLQDAIYFFKTGLADVLGNNVDLTFERVDEWIIIYAFIPSVLHEEHNPEQRVIRKTQILKAHADFLIKYYVEQQAQMVLMKAMA